MRFRGHIKKLVFGYIPKKFTYFGQTVYFPAGSHIFDRACAEGVYERDITNLILSLVKPGTTYFDVGANIGLLSVPVIAKRPGVSVISIEASPCTLPALQRTHLAATRNCNWTVVAAAAGSTAGETEFWTGGGASGAFDGIRNTGRGGPKRVVRVPVRTIDEIWQEHGCPAISVIKIDIEGGEPLALRGAREAIASTKPVIILEWTEKNFGAYGTDSAELLRVCADLGYLAYAFPTLVPISTKLVLTLAMRKTETFILEPRS